MTILGELVLPHGRRAWTQSLLEALALLGVQDKAARQAIARLHDSNWLDRTRVGRQTRWSLSDQAVELLEAGAGRIYGFGQEPRPWDETWLLLLASVPERDRSVRYRMGLGLNWAGFGSLGQGTWLSPWPEQEAVAVGLLEDLGVDATSFRATLGTMGSGSKLANQAWDLPALRAEYESFLATTDVSAEAERSGAEAAAELTSLVHHWRRFPFLDPDLPTALLPDDWPGPRAARRFAETRACLLQPATEWWMATEAHFTPVSGEPT